MGRLVHLRHTAPPIVRAAAAGYCLVDYSCPDNSGAWLCREFAPEVDAGLVCVIRVAGEHLFHKTRALNLGARRAIDAGARVLCFSDADTLLGPKSLETMQRLAGPGRFLIVPREANGKSLRSLSGVLVVSAQDFERVGGYDTEFIGWGSEDIAMRLKLHLVAGLEAVELPHGTARALQHSDRMRTLYSEDSDLNRNSERNHALLRCFVERWTGAGLEALPEAAKALLFRP